MAEGSSPLHAMNPTGRFADRAADYAAARPSYPDAAIDTVLAGLGDPSRIRAADIGAGTGISARLFADRGATVVAVEPNAAMRAAAAPHARVRWVDATAEATTLDAASIDLVLCAQAFHWFRAEAALAEFHRILRPGGRLALLWNVRDERDTFTRAYIEYIRAAKDQPGAHPADTLPFDPGVVHAAGLFAPAALAEHEYGQALDADGLIRRALSASYAPNTGPARERLTASLAALHARHADPASGLARLVYITRVYISTRR